MEAAKGDMGAVKLHLAKFLLAYWNTIPLAYATASSRADAVQPDTRMTDGRPSQSNSMLANTDDYQRWIAGIQEETQYGEDNATRLEPLLMAPAPG